MKVRGGRANGGDEAGATAAAAAAVAIDREDDWSAASVPAATAALACREDSYRKGCDIWGERRGSRGGIGGGGWAEDFINRVYWLCMSCRWGLRALEFDVASCVGGRMGLFVDVLGALDFLSRVLVPSTGVIRVPLSTLE